MADPDRLRFASLLALVALGCVAVVVIYRGWAWLVLWPAAAFAVVAAAYAVGRPALLGKTARGQRRGPALLVLAPFFAWTWVTWRAVTATRPCFHEVAPGIWLGRRPRACELPAGVGVVIDLTAEFAAARGVCGRVDYRCLPTLDRTAPDAAALLALVRELRDDPRGIYIHCALGHGRSATVAAALLLARGVASSPEEVEAWLAHARRGVKLSAGQRATLRAVHAALRAEGR